jgi:hypothetical protein
MNKQTESMSWTEANVVNPLSNVASDAYNALFVNTFGSFANKASQAIADKDVVKRAEHAAVGKSEGFSKETVTQAAVSGVGLALVYVASGRAASGLIRSAMSITGAEAKVAAVAGAENAAKFSRTVMSDKTGQISGAVAYDGLRDVRSGETRLGNMAGSLTAFGIYEKFNPKLANLNFGAKLAGYGVLGAGGSASAKLVSDGVSGHLSSAQDIGNSMLTGAALNMALPGFQRAAGLGLSKLNDRIGRGNPVERDLQLNGLAGKSETLDELAGKVASLRVKTGQETTSLRGKEVHLQGSGNAADRAHEFAHEWYLKSRKGEFDKVAQTLRSGDEVKAFMEYRQLRLGGETYAHRMEAQVAKEVGDPRKVELSMERIAGTKTPAGVTYDEQWRRDFERFKSTDGKVITEVDFRTVPSIAGVESMRELALRDPKAMKQVMREEYYPGLKKAFPDKSEYEKLSTYYGYLTDRNGTWDAVALRGSDGKVIGGIQSQVIPVDGKVIKNAVWGEHIWLAPEARSFPNFRGLMTVAADRFRATGSQVAFMEFNDRAKMSLQEMIQDAKGGLSTEAREVIWGRFANKGLNIAHFKDGKIAPYAQPGMDGQAPVNYLTLAMISLRDGKNLAGTKLPTEDYLKLLRNAHGTLVDVHTDPTVLAYTKELQDRIARGDKTMTFARLSDTTVGRIVGRQF